MAEYVDRKQLMKERERAIQVYENANIFSVWTHTWAGWIWHCVECCFTKWGAKRALKKYANKQAGHDIVDRFRL